MKTAFKSIAGLALLFLLFSCSKESGGSNEKVQLLFQPQEGREIISNMDIHSETKMLGMSIPLDMNVEYGMIPTEVSDTAVLVQFTYNRIYMKMQNPMTGAVEYDSEKPEEAKGIGADKMVEIYSGIIGESFTVKFDRYGNVIEMKDQSSEMGQVMGAFSNATDIKQYIQNVVPVFPEEAVGRGDSWTRKIITDDESGLSVETKYTVKRVDENEVVLELEGKVYPSAGDSTNVMIEISGQLDGELKIDRKSGWTRHGLIVQDLQMKVTQGLKSVNGTASNRIEITTK